MYFPGSDPRSTLPGTVFCPPKTPKSAPVPCGDAQSVDVMVPGPAFVRLTLAPVKAVGLSELTWMLCEGPPQMLMLKLPPVDRAFDLCGCRISNGTGETTVTIPAVAVALILVTAPAPTMRKKLFCTSRVIEIFT